MQPAQHRRLATNSWESLLRAQVAVMRHLLQQPIFNTVSNKEYDVLLNLSRSPNGWLRLNELNDSLLLTQPSISRLVDRLERKGLIERKTPSGDHRGVLIGLSTAGLKLQKEVGRAHVQNITQLMESALTETEMQTLLELTGKLRAAVVGASATAIDGVSPKLSGK